MYTAENQAHVNPIAPESRTDFYMRVTAELVIRRRLQQTGSTPGHAKLREQRERILGALAFNHLLNPDEPANSLNWSKAIEITQLVTGCDEGDAEGRFRALANDTGLITEERTGESFRFIHLTFCEFLAAFEAVRGRDDGWSQLLEAHKRLIASPDLGSRTRLLEVIPFATALLVPHTRQAEGIYELAEVGDRELVARSLYETKLYEHQLWATTALAEKEELLMAPERDWNGDWLRRLHTFNVMVRDANQSALHARGVATIDIGQFYQALIQRQRDSLEQLFSAYAVGDAAATFNLAELSGLDLAERLPDVVVKNCDQAPFFALVRQKAIESVSPMWLRLLVESSLRSHVVAWWLSTSETVRSWELASRKVNRHAQWFMPRFVAETPLTHALTIALQYRINDDSTPLLTRMSSIPPPGSRALFRLLSLIGAIMGMFVWLFYVALASSLITLMGDSYLSASRYMSILFFGGLPLSIAFPLPLLIWQRTYTYLLFDYHARRPNEVWTTLLLGPMGPLLKRVRSFGIAEDENFFASRGSLAFRLVTNPSAQRAIAAVVAIRLGSTGTTQDFLAEPRPAGTP